MRISNHHGSRLKLLHLFRRDWGRATGNPLKPDNLFDGMLDAGDCFQCATFNFLHGYYRSALSDLRSALELVTIGAFGNVRPDDPVYLRWRAGSADLAFPSCRKRLQRAVAGAPLAWFLKAGAWPEQVYYDLCRYTHSRPDAGDGSLWESNGPVYNGRAIRLTFEMTLCVYAISYLLAKIGRPSLVIPKRKKFNRLRIGLASRTPRGGESLRPDMAKWIIWQPTTQTSLVERVRPLEGAIAAPAMPPK